MARNKDNDWFKKKWKGVPITPLNIDEHMSDIYKKTKGQYVTQGVSFNKDDSFQMGLLRQAILTHGTFSSFMKHLMHTYFVQQQQVAQMHNLGVMVNTSPPLHHQQQTFSWSPDESLRNNNHMEQQEIEKEDVEEQEQEQEPEKQKIENGSDDINLDDKKPKVDTTTTGNEPKVTINKPRSSRRRGKGGNPFLETND